MFERFTAQARSVVTDAQREARELGHPRIGTHHVLLAMSGRPEAAGGRVLGTLGLHADRLREDVRNAARPSFTDEDAEALRFVGIDLDEVRRSVEDAFGPGALDQDVRTAGDKLLGHIPFTPGSKKALELALREAIHLGHRYIGTEHLLLGLVRDERSSAARILADHGIDAERVRAEVLREIANGGDRPSRTA
ncbi:MAG TPA: Clp protease N-terminal domain-containing protein [Actinomycetota bacterium]|nr:Clp protease N-terminal domain-containing protein [Actinomycetota bacterium]